MPLEWKAVIVVAAILPVAVGFAVVGLYYGLRRGWRALRPRAVAWLTGWLKDPYQPAAFDGQDGDHFAEDLLDEVTRVQQDPLTRVPLPRLESERGGIQCGQLYPLSAADRADIALDAEHKRLDDL